MKALPANPAAAARDVAASSARAGAAERRALLRDYFHAMVRQHSLDQIPEVFWKDLESVAGELGLLAGARGLYDGAMRILQFGAKLVGKSR